MIVEFDKSFEKSLDKVKDNTLLPKIEKIILNLESANAITDISGVKNFQVIRIIIVFVSAITV